MPNARVTVIGKRIVGRQANASAERATSRSEGRGKASGAVPVPGEVR